MLGIGQNGYPFHQDRAGRGQSIWTWTQEVGITIAPQLSLTVQRFYPLAWRNSLPDEKTAFALAGLGGFNAHVAGFLAAARDYKMPRRAGKPQNQCKSAFAPTGSAS
jgi:hypothetical protein